MTIASDPARASELALLVASAAAAQQPAHQCDCYASGKAIVLLPTAAEL